MVCNYFMVVVNAENCLVRVGSLDVCDVLQLRVLIFRSRLQLSIALLEFIHHLLTIQMFKGKKRSGAVRLQLESVKGCE